MKLHRNWREIVRHAWSVRLLALAAVLSGAEVGLPLIQTVIAIPAGIFAALSALATGGAFAARLIAQKQFGGE